MYIYNKFVVLYSTSLYFAGQVVYGKNGHNVATLMHVDKTLPMWAFFDVYGNTQKIKCLGIYLYCALLDEFIHAWVLVKHTMMVVETLNLTCVCLSVILCLYFTYTFQTTLGTHSQRFLFKVFESACNLGMSCWIALKL